MMMVMTMMMTMMMIMMAEVGRAGFDESHMTKTMKITKIFLAW